MVERTGIEPVTPTMSTWCSPAELTLPAYYFYNLLTIPRPCVKDGLFKYLTPSTAIVFIIFSSQLSSKTIFVLLKNDYLTSMNSNKNDFSFNTRFATSSVDAFISDESALLEPQKIGGKNLNSPVVLSVPHGGRFYPSKMVNNADLNAMRTLEDVGSDIIVMPSINVNQCAIIANCSRAIIDVNRPKSALDPKLIKNFNNKAVTIDNDRWRRYINSGYGVIPRLSAKRLPLYGVPPTCKSIEYRIDNWHVPYHTLISETVNEASRIFQKSVLLDIHSMPQSSPKLPDIVIGDMNGRSASRDFSDIIRKELKKFDLTFAMNIPYAGGFIAENHGKPTLNKHAIQIEINRDLYLKNNYKISNEAVRELGILIGDIIKSVGSLC